METPLFCTKSIEGVVQSHEVECSVGSLNIVVSFEPCDEDFGVELVSILDKATCIAVENSDYSIIDSVHR